MDDTINLPKQHQTPPIHTSETSKRTKTYHTSKQQATGSLHQCTYAHDSSIAKGNLKNNVYLPEHSGKGDEGTGGCLLVARVKSREFFVGQLLLHDSNVFSCKQRRRKQHKEEKLQYTQNILVQRPITKKEGSAGTVLGFETHCNGLLLLLLLLFGHHKSKCYR